MEFLSDSEPYISPTVQNQLEWQEVFADGDLKQRFVELVSFTRDSVDTREYPWANDPHDVAARWQHLIVLLGQSARMIGHPLFEAHHWTDKQRVEEVLAPIPYRSVKAPFVEKSLILTHSLVINRRSSDASGFTVYFNEAISMGGMHDPAVVAANTKTFDLRDMAEPTETVIGDLTIEDYFLLSPEEREDLSDRLDERYSAPNYGNGYGWLGPPQSARYLGELRTLRDYDLLLTFGTTDETEIDTIRDVRKAVEIALLRADQPEFGELPENFDALSERQQLCIDDLFEYFDNMRDPFADIAIDSYSLFRTLGFDSQDVQGLIEAGVLVETKPVASPIGALKNFRVTQSYYEAWVSRHYTATF